VGSRVTICGVALGAALFAGPVGHAGVEAEEVLVVPAGATVRSVDLPWIVPTDSTGGDPCTIVGREGTPAPSGILTEE
jgi:hypothetical protein